MLKFRTKNRLVERLNELICVSSWMPILAFVIEKVDFEGYYDLGWTKTYHELDEIIPKLMDLSLTHRIAKIWWQEYMFRCGMCVCFEILESKDGNTNIDSGMLDLILKLNCKKLPSGAWEE